MHVVAFQFGGQRLGEALAAQVLEAVGEVVWCNNEGEIDSITALSGSGPAYVFYFIEALQDAALQLGLDETQARELALATFAGAAELATQSSEPASVLPMAQRYFLF